MKTITIKTMAGKIITRKASITDKIDSNGQQYSIAVVGRSVYRIIDRDYYGPIWGVM